jgi:hypothetical protein
MLRPSQKRGKAIAGVLALGIVSPFAAPVFSADIRLGNSVPGAGLIHKNIVSMREARYTNRVARSTDFRQVGCAVRTIKLNAK